MPLRVGRVLEASAVAATAAVLAYGYSVFLGGLPYGVLVDLYRALGGGFEKLKSCWVRDGLGKPNDRLPFTPLYALPALLKLLGADLNTACLGLMQTLWGLGGCSTYLLAKRFSGSRLAGLTATLIYLGAAAALRGVWCSLDPAALYALTPLAILAVDEAYRRKSPSYGFYAALASTLFSGALAKLEGLAVLTLTALAYFTVRIRGDAAGWKWVGLFSAVAGSSWLALNIWWLAVPPGLKVEPFNPLCLAAYPIMASTLLLMLKVGEMNTAQALAVAATALVLMDPRGLTSSNLPPELLAAASVDISLLTALGVKRFADRFSEHLSVSLIWEGDGAKEYDLTRPLIALTALAVILYQGFAAPPSWISGLNIPDYYGELSSLAPPGGRVLPMPVATGDVYYSWTSWGFEWPIECLTMGEPIVYGGEFYRLNDLTGRAGFWKLLSALNVGLIVVHHDIGLDRVEAVDPQLIETRLNYSFIVKPHLAGGVVDTSSEDVKPLMESLGFVQLVNFNREAESSVEARPIGAEEAQSRIHLYARGEPWLSEEPTLNGTFSFAYTLPKASDWLGYGYLECWFKVNGSNTVTVQVQDVFGRSAIWRLNLEEHSWNLLVLKLNDPDLDAGLDKSRVTSIAFSLHAPLGRFVEAEVGGVFLDKGFISEDRPLEALGKLDGRLTLYRLKDEFRTPKLYTADRVLSLKDDAFENLLKDWFDPRRMAYVDGEPMEVSHAELEYAEEGPTRYRLNAQSFSGRFLVVLCERFDPGWTLYVGDTNPVTILAGAEQPNVKHVRVNGLLNGWYVEPEESKPLKMTIIYRPQPLMETLRILSTAFAASGLTILPLKGKIAETLKRKKPKT